MALALFERAMQILLECAGASAVGRRRNNEDAFLVDGELGLFVVADGMGGYEGGEIASATVVASLHAFFRRHDVDADGTWPFREQHGLGLLENLVDVGLRVAHRDVVARKHGVLAKMGSTAVVVLFRGSELVRFETRRAPASVPRFRKIEPDTKRSRGSMTAGQRGRTSRGRARRGSFPSLR